MKKKMMMMFRSEKDTLVCKGCLLNIAPLDRGIKPCIKHKTFVCIECDCSDFKKESIKMSWIDVYLSGYLWYRKLTGGTWYQHIFTQDAAELTFTRGN